jgi:hypothetical protein
MTIMDHNAGRRLGSREMLREKGCYRELSADPRIVSKIFPGARAIRVVDPWWT